MKSILIIARAGFFACVVFILAGKLSGQAQDASVAACWDFEQVTDQAVADVSGNGNFMYPGNAMDLPGCMGAGLFGKAVHLGDHNDYMAVLFGANTYLSNLGANFTAALRIKVDQIKQDGIILAYNRDGLQWSVGLNRKGELITGLVNNRSKAGVKCALPESAAEKFVHLVILFDAAKGPRAIYLDGRKMAIEATREFWGVADTDGLLIGGRKRAAIMPDKNFHGWLDDLLIFRGTLTAIQARRLAENPYDKLFKLPKVQIPENHLYWNTITGLGSGQKIADRILLGGMEIAMDKLPASLRLEKAGGLLLNRDMETQTVHAWPMPFDKLNAVRCFVAPNGDWVVMFAAGRSHYGERRRATWSIKISSMIQYRSTDHGKTWSGPTVAWVNAFSDTFVIPFIPRGSKRIYVFSTEADPKFRFSKEDGPVVYRTSDDNGVTWSKPTRIRPVNDPEYVGISAMRMCETDSGVWILGTHTGNWEAGRKIEKHPKSSSLETRQYVLVSEDKGKTWILSPGKRNDGWCVEEYNRMDEGRPIGLGGGKALLMIRTAEGHLWETRTDNDGKTWSSPKPTTLVHPDAPPMLFHLSDGKTLIAFHHNKYDPKKPHFNNVWSRDELWFSLSTDDGRSWSEPRFVLADALSTDVRRQVSYADLIVESGVLSLWIAPNWERAVQVRFKEADLMKFPTLRQLREQAAIYE